MKHLNIFFGFGLTLALSLLAEATTNNDCQKCHEKQVPSHSYFQSVHKDLACTACHAADEAQAKKAPSIKQSKNQCVTTFKQVDCAKCHAQEVKDYSTSVHNSQRLPISCAKCHADIHSIQSAKKDKIAIANKCSECHSRQKDYFDSTHHQAIEKGNNDAATCTDCHGLHSVQKVDNDAKGRTFHTMTCLKCHDDKAMMTKSKVTTIAGETYFKSFHGKNVHLGYPEKVAGCADCHNAHLVLKAKDERASINKNNLVNTCIQCHGGATAAFTKYVPHADDENQDKFPALYWTRIAMTGLLVGTFLFFWLHSILWAIRIFIEKNEKAKKYAMQGDFESHHSAIKSPNKLYKRFEKKHIYLHVLVVVSFLALSLTGLPLKFSNTAWSKAVMDFIGGASKARFIHHTAAVVTFFYFAIALWMSFKFLFSNKEKGSFAKKLFGPESLFPNWRDWEDLKAMFRWFFHRGKKPTFERWTYWEKFDFMAVFWGMFAIGLSGLMLWFPELFAKFLPGWMFNIATIIHSDEALLATGFIFTVHFFNTHIRPEKFPMDFVIFNGEVTKYEMLEERGDQWKRLEKENRLEELEVKKPSSLMWDFFFRVFGFAAVVIGVSLVAGMIYAMLAH